MKAPDGTIDCRAGESGSTTNKGNSSPPQLFSIQGGDKVLLSLVQVRKQQGVFLLKFVSGAHSSSIAEPSPFVTPNDLRALSMKLHLTPGRWHAAVDGKTARHSFDHGSPKSAMHLLTAWASENGFTLGQMAVEDKTNEITGIPKLLEILYLERAVVTIDAIGCQKKIAEKVQEKKADYILAVKGNQPHLFEDIKDKFDKHAESPGPESTYSTHEENSKGHGRRETRTCIVLNDLEGIREIGDWKDAKRVACVFRQCWEGDRYSEEFQHYLGSYDGMAKDYLAYSRKHWGIENGQHYILDVTFREDDNRTRKDHGPENIALVRRIALSLLSQEKSTKMTTPTKRLHACGNDDYLLKILSGIEE